MRSLTYFWATLLGTEQVGSEQDQIYCQYIVGGYVCDSVGENLAQIEI